MQSTPDELIKVMAERLKLGDQAKPVCRVEVDRMAFVPGRIESVGFVTNDAMPNVLYEQKFIPAGTNGETAPNPLPIVFPIKGKTYRDDLITSGFGLRSNPTGKGTQIHKGIDIGVPTGTDVVAAFGGTVKTVDMSQSKDNYGYYVDIQHADGVITRYGHLSAIPVVQGQKVNQGELIAKSGSTGNSTGPHLHFEIQIDGTPVDPKPYLLGEQQMYRGHTVLGAGVVSGGQFSGTIGAEVFTEFFETRNWTSDPGISGADLALLSHSAIEWNSDTSYLKVTFSDKVANTVGFNFKLNINQPGIMRTRYAGAADGLGEYRIYIGGKLQFRAKTFKGAQFFEEQKDIVFPGGNYDVRVEFETYGTEPCTFLVDNIAVNELDGRPDLTGNIQAIDPTKGAGHYEELEISSFLSGGSVQRASLQVGEFVYMDTLVLDNIITCEIDDQVEADSSTAKITISNPNGYYSPDYNPFNFPETYMDTPWSYFINGFHYGVLSENTPIRIFKGYGQNMMRTFTGLIDKIDLDSESAQITITARDMYKKVLDKVITEDKHYPKDSVIDPAMKLGTISSNMTRRQEIIALAKYNAARFQVPLDYRFLLAICQHETVFGTSGWGEEGRDYILGYAVYDEQTVDKRYKGVSVQLYYGARRMRDALKSRNYTISSFSDVDYFYHGGDHNTRPDEFKWAADPNWPNAVWAIYQQYTTSPPADFEATPAWVESGTPAVPSAVPAVTPESTQQIAWLKSSIITDLIKHAGMTGWRRAAVDIPYPDYIIEETYLIEVNQKSGKYIKAIPGKEGEFEKVDIQAVLTPAGWLNPFYDLDRKWDAFKAKVGDCISEVMKDTNYRSYCDRNGTYRLEQIDMYKPVVATFSEHDNLVNLTKTIDYTRGRSHVMVIDNQGGYSHFVDTELLMELKGEVRSSVISVPYALTREAKRQVAEKFFWDIKRLCRTLQVTIPGNPALDVLDRVYISNRTTTTRSVYTIKGIRSTYSVQEGYMQFIDLTWSGEGAVL